MGPQLFLIVGLFLQLLSAHELYARESPACQFSVAASYLGETCDTFTRRWHIDRATFLSLNPGADCSGLADDRTYCVQPSPSVSATSMATTSSTTTATSTATLSTTTDSSAVSSSTSTDSSTATSSTSTGSSTGTSSITADSSTATTESATPTASSESSATASTIPLQITMILTLLLSLCFI